MKESTCHCSRYRARQHARRERLHRQAVKFEQVLEAVRKRLG